MMREGETCDRLTRADRATVLVDAASYYGALRKTLLEARRSIAIAGWDIDSRTPIRGDEPPEDGAPLLLGPLLTWLAERRPGLVVRVLLWDYSVLYTLEREPLPRLSLDWKTPANVRVCLDNKLPFGASHHEKIVVVDDRVAFCGGIDLTIRRWDRMAHAAKDADRVDPEGEAYAPFHDLQMVVDAGAARALGELVLARWNRAAGTDDSLTETEGDPWPSGLEPDFRDVGIGIARTRPEYGEESALRQIEAAYLEAIGNARKLVYIENQYLTVDAIAKALLAQLEAVESLEIVIVNSERQSGWLEEQTMGRGRDRFLARFPAEYVGERIRFVYPWVAGEDGKVPVKVHAKIMIVDDERLQLGSSNLNCRSMGVDRECDLVIAAGSDAERDAVRAVRRRLMAHHLGVEPDALAAAEDESSSVLAAIDAVADDARGFAAIPPPAVREEDIPDLLGELADPEQPMSPDRFVGDLFGAEPARTIRRHFRKLLIVAGVIAVALAIWRFTPLGEWADPDRLGALLARIGESAWSGPIVLLCFVVGSFLIFPVTVLIAASAVALGPVPGFCWAVAGSLASAALNFYVGRLLPEDRLEHWFGKWLGKLSKRLRHGGIVPMMLLRNVPVAPFPVVNFAAGAFRLRPRDFMIGTTLGMLPGIAALTILGDRMRGYIENPHWGNVAWLVLAIALWIGVALGLQAASNRLARKS